LPRRGAAPATGLGDLERGLSLLATQPYFTFTPTNVGHDATLSAAGVPLTTRPWHVVLAKPRAEFLAPIDLQMRQTILLALVLGCAVLAAALMIAGVLARPIVHLRAVAGRVAEGDLDVSAKVRSQDEIGELGSTFNRMTGELRKVRNLEERLARSRKMEALGLLAGGVAHDLNNVLSGIVGYPDLILMDLPADSPLRKPILTMQQSGKKSAAIVQDLLALSRRGVASSALLSLNDDIVADYLRSPEHAQLSDHHPDVRVDTQLAPSVLSIRGSVVHLRKTVTNLVSNAAEAQPHGGRILIATENRYVDRAFEGYQGIPQGEYVVLRVEDQGVGISPGDLDRIFEPFYTKKVMGRSGTGLGMAVVWGTVQDHDGYIDIRSAEGQGTSFELYFPAVRGEADKAKGPLPIDEYMGGRQTVLVVDDAENQREIAAGMLARLDYEVTTVGSGEEAVDYLDRNDVDLLVLDMIMEPGIDGLETYRRIVTQHPGQKAVIASGFSDDARVREAQRLGAGSYVQKPYTLEQLGLAVKAELGDTSS
jgi:two-component system cell cycle sensor histidine kinase/response regulator CckA